MAARNPWPALPFPIVEVVWLDAYLQADGTYFGGSDVATDDPGTINRSVGYLLREDADCVKIAMEATHNGEGFRDVLTIPTSIVRRVKRMR